MYIFAFVVFIPLHLSLNDCNNVIKVDSSASQPVFQDCTLATYAFYFYFLLHCIFFLINTLPYIWCVCVCQCFISYTPSNYSISITACTYVCSTKYLTFIMLIEMYILYNIENTAFIDIGETTLLLCITK